MSSSYLIEGYLNDQLPRPVSRARLFEDSELWKTETLTESAEADVERVIPSVSDIAKKVRDVSADTIQGIRDFISGFFKKLFGAFKKAGKIVWNNLPKLNVRYAPPAKLVVSAVMPRASDLNYSLHVDLYVDLLEKRVDIEISGHIGDHIDFDIARFRAYEADDEEPDEYVKDVEKSVDRAEAVVVPKYEDDVDDSPYDRRGDSPFKMLPA